MQVLIRCLINFEEIRGIWPDLPQYLIVYDVWVTLALASTTNDVGGHDASTRCLINLEEKR